MNQALVRLFFSLNDFQSLRVSFAELCHDLCPLLSVFGDLSESLEVCLVLVKLCSVVQVQIGLGVSDFSVQSIFLLVLLLQSISNLVVNLVSRIFKLGDVFFDFGNPLLQLSYFELVSLEFLVLELHNEVLSLLLLFKDDDVSLQFLILL